jgi:hypothetical protein
MSAALVEIILAILNVVQALGIAYLASESNRRARQVRHYDRPSRREKGERQRS